MPLKNDQAIARAENLLSYFKQGVKETTLLLQDLRKGEVAKKGKAMKLNAEIGDAAKTRILKRFLKPKI